MRAAVIGAGLSALTAARELAAAGGAEIRVFSVGAGASPFVHGFNIPLCPGDSPEAFARDTLESGRGLSDPGLVARLCWDSVKVPPFLREHGVELDRDGGGYALLQPLGSSFPRVACSGSHTGVRILSALSRELRQNPRVRFADHTRVLRVQCAGGRVCGITAFDEREKRFFSEPADCVVLAPGGFCGIYPFSTNPPDTGGDGIAMAYRAGAVLTDMEFVQFEPSAAVYPPQLRGQSVITTMFYEGAVLRNARGERFMLRRGEEAERVNKDVLSLCIAEELQNGGGTAHGGVYFDATGVGAEVLRQKYASYAERYRRCGIDIGREMFEIAPAAHTSLGGVAIDENCAASVAGLFAAGEVTGGIHGANRIGGNAGLETLVFGIRAGQSAARYLQKEKTPRPPLPDAPIPEDVSLSDEELRRIREKMERRLDVDLSVIRDGAGLAAAKQELGALLRQVMETLGARGKDKKAPPQLVYEAMRLENDLLCALLLAASALERTGSAGCHVRRDCVEESGRYNVLLRSGGNGPEVSRKYR